MSEIKKYGPDTPWSYFGIETTKAQADVWRQKAEDGTCPFCEKSLARSSFGSKKKHLVACTKKRKP